MPHQPQPTINPQSYTWRHQQIELEQKNYSNLQHKIKNQLISNKSNLAVKYGKILRERKVINLEYTCITNGEEKKNNEVFTYFIRPSI